MAEVTAWLHNRPCQGRVVIDDKMKAAIEYKGGKVRPVFTMDYKSKSSGYEEAMNLPRTSLYLQPLNS